MSQLLTLEEGNWYAWEMLPGYAGSPYFSPIRIDHVEPRNTGRGILGLRFFNACYAQGVQDFALDVRVLWRSPEHLFATIESHSKSPSNRCAIISHISFDWMHRNLPEITKRCPPLSEAGGREAISDYLERLLRQ